MASFFAYAVAFFYFFSLLVEQDLQYTPVTWFLTGLLLAVWLGLLDQASQIFLTFIARSVWLDTLRLHTQRTATRSTAALQRNALDYYKFVLVAYILSDDRLFHEATAKLAAMGTSEAFLRNLGFRRINILPQALNHFLALRHRQLLAKYDQLLLEVLTTYDIDFGEGVPPANIEHPRVRVLRHKLYLHLVNAGVGELVGVMKRELATLKRLDVPPVGLEADYRDAGVQFLEDFLDTFEQEDEFVGLCRVRTISSDPAAIGYRETDL